MESGNSADAAPPNAAMSLSARPDQAGRWAAARRSLRLAGFARVAMRTPEVGSFPVPVSALRARPDDGLLRALDVCIAGLAVLLLAPLLALIAAGVRVSSPGPVLFRQTRYGRYGKPFTILKFRTMTCLEDGEHVRQACRNDARVTSFGRILRKLSLDELPQLFNVLAGSMSLVGPRPHAIAHDRRFSRVVNGYGARFAVRPGITGLAQVRGLRGEIFTDEQIRQRVLTDILYVRRRSAGLYCRVLAATAALVFFQAEAY